MTRARGFSLVELLVAVGITATMGVMTIGALQGVDRAASGARAQAERYAAARLALSRIAREVSMAFLSDNYDARRYTDGRPTRFEGREDELLFTTMAHERLYRDAKESDQSVVAYTVESDPEHSGERALFRREKPRIDEEPERGGRKDLVADRMTRFELRYWDPERKDWSREWTTRSVDHADQLPSRVRIELEMRLPDGRTERLSTEARIAITRPLKP